MVGGASPTDREEQEDEHDADGGDGAEDVGIMISMTSLMPTLLLMAAVPPVMTGRSSL
ncbi:hypothetical protein ACWGS9_00090 [Bradyrhizobium sp. Arg314]